MRFFKLFFTILSLFIFGLEAAVRFSNVNGSISQTAKTYNYFEVEYAFFNRTRCILSQVNPKNNTSDCQFAAAAPLRSFNATRTPYQLLDYDCTVALLSFDYALQVGCNNVFQMSEGVLNSWVPTLPAVGFPSKIITLLVVMPRNLPGEIAGPVKTPYLSHDLGTSDGPPLIDTIFMTKEDAMLFLTNFATVSEVVAEVSSELGAWNEIFLNNGYRGFRWFMFAMNCLLLIYSMYRLFLAALKGAIKFDKRNLIFIGGLVSEIMFAVQLTVRHQTMLYFLMDLICSYFFMLAFYVLLSLWSAILAQVQTRRPHPLVAVIYIGAINATINVILGLIWLLHWPNDTWTSIHDGTRYFVLATQVSTGLVFFFYAVRFQLRKNSYNASRNTRQALGKLAWLAVLGFFTFTAKGCTSFFAGDITVAGSPSATLTVFIFVDIITSVRAFAVLFILGVRVPEAPKQSQTATFSTLTNKSRRTTTLGGISTGWRKAILGSQATESAPTVPPANTSSGLVSTTTGFSRTRLESRMNKTARLSNGSGVVTTPMQEVPLLAGDAKP